MTNPNADSSTSGNGRVAVTRDDSTALPITISLNAAGGTPEPVLNLDPLGARQLARQLVAVAHDAGDDRCSAALRGDIAWANIITADRGWRWIIAIARDIIDGDQGAAVQHIQNEVGDCLDCLQAVAWWLARAIVVTVAERVGAEGTIAAVEERRREMLAAESVPDPDSGPE